MNEPIVILLALIFGVWAIGRVIFYLEDKGKIGFPSKEDEAYAKKMEEEMPDIDLDPGYKLLVTNVFHRDD